MMRTWLCACCTLLIASCVYDPDDRCDPGQRVERDLCVCLDGMIPAEVGCEPCGEHETANGNVCECDDGFERSEPEGPCEEVSDETEPDCGPDAGSCEQVSTELGDNCDPAADEPECAGDYAYCQASEFDVGYCTATGCGGDDDCVGGYLCDDRESPSVCVRPPVGEGDACESDEDCEGKEASYCVTLMDAGCRVDGCTAPDVGCAPGTVCCDLESVGLAQLCVPEDLCPF